MLCVSVQVIDDSGHFYTFEIPVSVSIPWSSGYMCVLCRVMPKATCHSPFRRMSVCIYYLTHTHSCTHTHTGFLQIWPDFYGVCEG